ncbi:MAG TPA: dienelactone hydrolase family protein [Streptosporangiaceae bacterium]|nr:dienelactone hydrolase family protein [Streptosporangiaceae bacterium]
MPEVTVGSTSGYLAVPAGPPPGPWPGVVVIHESWGLNGDIRAHADRLAAQGYLALAPDLYRGKSFVRCFRDAFRQLHAGTGPVVDLLDKARAVLAARPDCTGKIGVLGFCMGGGFALLCAPRGDFSVASVNYGEVPGDAERVLAGSCPIVASYGARDPMGAGPPQRLEEALTALNVPHEVKVYPGAGHSFMSTQPAALTPLARLARLDYKPESAEDSWRRIFAFFGEHLDS